MHCIFSLPCILSKGANNRGSICPSLYITVVSTVSLTPSLMTGTSLTATNVSTVVTVVELNNPSLIRKVIRRDVPNGCCAVLEYL